MFSRITLLLTATLGLVFLTSAPAEARRTTASQQNLSGQVTQFCGDRYGACQGARESPRTAGQPASRRGTAHQAATDSQDAAPASPRASQAAPNASNLSTIGAPDLIAAMRKDIGRNPVGWAHIWCAKYLNVVLARQGYEPAGGDGRNIASHFRYFGTPVAPGTKGAIVAMSGHAGVAMGYCDKGRGVEVISGNHTGHVVGIGCYPKGRIIAWRAPREVARRQDEAKAFAERTAPAADVASPAVDAPYGTATAMPPISFYPYSEYLPEKPAKGVLAAMGGTPIGSVREEVDRAADVFGLDRQYMRAVAKIESGFDPRQRTGQYVGVFQLSRYEFGTYGEGQILNARDNSVAAAAKLVSERVEFAHAVGRDPDRGDSYLVHQQGLGGAIAHLTHPDQVAWRSMCSTEEGHDKGEKWCRKAIWGNVLPEIKRSWKSVERLTSAAFVAMWRDRVDEFYRGGRNDLSAKVAAKVEPRKKRHYAHHHRRTRLAQS